MDGYRIAGHYLLEVRHKGVVGNVMAPDMGNHMSGEVWCSIAGYLKRPAYGQDWPIEAHNPNSPMAAGVYLVYAQRMVLTALRHGPP